MYHALLPPKTVKALKTEYRVRLLIVFLFFASLAIVISAFFLFPSYLVSGMAERTASAQAGGAGAATDTAAVPADLSAAGSLVSAISSSVSPPLSPVVLHIASIRPAGISIASFDVAYSGAASSTVTIEGSAATRDDLVAFKKVLEADTAFSGVEIPISDLAPSSDLQFSLQMSAALAEPQQTL